MNQLTEIAHVLFLDIVGYSQETTASQARMVAQMNAAVSGCPTYQAAREGGSVLSLPTGDGMALLFTGDIGSPARCALELAQRSDGLNLRMGIHSGPVQRNRDIDGRDNVAGEGINLAQRVMACASEGGIALSEQYAAWLCETDGWKDRIRPPREFVAKHGLRLRVHALGDGVAQDAGTPSKEVVILYKRNAQPDEALLAKIEGFLLGRGYGVFIDRHLKIGVDWAKAIEERIRTSDWIVAIVSDGALGSEMLEYELDVALDEHRKRGKPFILPLRIGKDRPLEGPVGTMLNPLNFAVWTDAKDDERVLQQILATIEEPAPPTREIVLEPVGGAVPPDSKFYVERATDAEFLNAVARQESILLVKGPRQVGKTSLIGRGAQYANVNGYRLAHTDFQKLSTAQLMSDERFYMLLARTLAKTLGFQYDFENEWLDVFGPNMNLDNFVRALVESSDQPLVWFMDEADKLFGTPYASDFFGLVRSWHNSRAIEPGASWSRFTVVLGYATEAHLFIQDLNQSPFNVGRQIALDDFNSDQVRELNERYGEPLNPTEIDPLMALIGGQPFLVRRALDVVARGSTSFQGLLECADRDEGPFGDHLRRILISVSQLPEVIEALRESMKQPDLRDLAGYARLLAAGIVRQKPNGLVELRYELYRRYLASHLK